MPGPGNSPGLSLYSCVWVVCVGGVLVVLFCWLVLVLLVLVGWLARVLLVLAGCVV